MFSKSYEFLSWIFFPVRFDFALLQSTEVSSASSSLVSKYVRVAFLVEANIFDMYIVGSTYGSGHRFVGTQHESLKEVVLNR